MGSEKGFAWPPTRQPALCMLGQSSVPAALGPRGSLGTVWASGSCPFRQRAREHGAGRGTLPAFPANCCPWPRLGSAPLGEEPCHSCSRNPCSHPLLPRDQRQPWARWSGQGHASPTSGLEGAGERCTGLKLTSPTGDARLLEAAEHGDGF